MKRSQEAPPPPAAKKFKAPTSDEIQALKETTDLFQSNLFRLQIAELVNEAGLDYAKTGSLDKALHGIKAVLDACKPLKDLDLGPAVAALKKQGVIVPFPSKPDAEAIKYKFSFQTPEKVFIAGSYLVKTIVKSKAGFNVDLAVQMPSSIFTEKDHVNNRYFYKRAYYLAVIAAALRKTEQYSNISFELLNKDPRRPIIVVTSASEDKSVGFGHLGGPGGVKIRILPVIAPDLFPVHKLAPSRNNNRPASAAGGEGNTVTENLPPTPRYNSSILMDTSLVSHLNALHKQAASCSAFRDAVMLGKVWLNQRGLDSSSFGGFLWSLVIVYLMGSGNKVNKSTDIFLKESFSSYQIVKLTLDFLANHNFAEEPLFMTPNGLPIDHPDFSAQSFTKQFDCVIVDSTGRINLAAFLNASALNHLQFEAKASLSLFKDLGGDRFDSIFLKNLTEPIGYYDLVLRINKIPSTFAAYKSSIELDFPSKRQFFSHFTTRLLKLAIKTRTQLIKVSDVNHQPSIAWEVDESVPEDDEESAVFIGLILNPATAYEPVEQGPASGEDENLIENFRRIWGTKSSLRRFNDGTILESVVWDFDGSAEGKQEDISFWGGQFTQFLHEFGGVESRAVAEKRTGSFSAATEAFNAFSRAIKGLEGIPLDITGVIACDPGLRYSSDAMDVLIDFESSTKWPETIPALQHMKLAFYIKLAELIAEKVSGALATVTKPDLADLSSGCLNVRMPSGYSFRARLRTGLEVPMSAKALKTAQGTEDSALIHAATTRFRNVDKLFRAIASHTNRFQNVHYRYTQLSTTVRLVKRWLAAHWLAPHFSDVAIELLVTKVFVDHAPYPTAPACAFTGFMRVLELLWKWDFESEPLVVEFEKNELSTEMRAQIRFNFTGKTDEEQEIEDAAVAEAGEEEFKKRKAVMNLATLDDLTGHFWTDDGPSLIVMKRVKQLAKASLKLLKEAVMVGDDEEVDKIFITPTEGYDYIIQLDPSKLSKYHQNISYDDKCLPKSKSKFKNLAALDKDPLQRFLEEFNPVEKYLEDLQQAFGETMAFFYDGNGCDRIGVLLNKKIVVPLQPWRVNLPYSVKPVLEEAADETVEDIKSKKNKEAGGKNKKEKKKRAMVEPDYASIGAALERLGLGLVTSVSSSFE
ncbi:Nrap protein [Obelidium mucronatum]|nr:Nrap protein [Obelidium mucronatum]